MFSSKNVNADKSSDDISGECASRSVLKRVRQAPTGVTTARSLFSGLWSEFLKKWGGKDLAIGGKWHQNCPAIYLAKAGRGDLIRGKLKSRE